MAGDWLKIEVALPEKPEVWQIAGILQIDPDAVVGKLLKVWRWFDAHTESGNAVGVTYALVDSITGVTGFGEAMALCAWLEQDGSILRLPHFDRHNGKTAKNRALTAKRVAKTKQKGNAKGNGDSVTDALPREEKRREEEKKEEGERIPLDDGTNFHVTDDLLAEFRSAYPRIDVLAEVRKARAWCVANPAKRKTRKGATRFLNNWLAGASEKAPAPAAPARKRPLL